MISSCVQNLFLIVFLISITCETKHTCNDSCSTKTFYYKDEVSVTFTAQQINGNNYLTINLVAYNINETGNDVVSVLIKSGPDINEYTCGHAPDGSIHSYYMSPTGLTSRNGSPIYKNNTSNCTWTLSRENLTWPTNSNGTKLDLEANSDYDVIVENEDRPLITTNTKDLPIYHMNFLKCCNKVYGDDKIQLIVKKTDYSNEFTLFLIYDTPGRINYTYVELFAPRQNLIFECAFHRQQTASWAIIGGQGLNIDPQIYYSKVTSKRLFSWSVPNVISGFCDDHDTRNLVYGLMLVFKTDKNQRYEYEGSGVSLNGQDSTQISRGTNTCDGSCLNKTYSYKDVASVHFAAEQINETDYLTINLVGFNIEESQHHQVSFSFNYESSLIFKYFCERNASGSTASYFNGTQGLVIDGTSIYRDNTLYCSWTISRVLNNYPRNSNGKPIDLEVYSDFEIILANNTDELVVASNTKDLPVYHMNFFKCCNKVYGDDKVQLIVRQTNYSSDFTLLLYDRPQCCFSNGSVQLTSSDGNQLMFDCSFKTRFIDGRLKTDDQEVSINALFLYRNVYMLSGECNWSIPIVISAPSGDHDTRNRVYDLKITHGNQYYTESGITLTS